MFDVPMKERGRRVTELVAVLRAAFAGEPFEYRGRTVHITPAPFRPGGPSITLGGSSKVGSRSGGSDSRRLHPVGARGVAVLPG